MGSVLDYWPHRLSKDSDTDCYVWTGSVSGSKEKRPTVWHDGKMVSLTRLVCVEAHGPPPTNKHQAAHKPPCRNGLCVNPAHLYWATPKQNMMDVPEEVRKQSAAKALAAFMKRRTQ